MFDHPLSLLGVYSSILNVNFVQQNAKKNSTCVSTGKKKHSKPEK